LAAVVTAQLVITNSSRDAVAGGYRFRLSKKSAPSSGLTLKDSAYLFASFQNRGLTALARLKIPHRAAGFQFFLLIEAKQFSFFCFMRFESQSRSFFANR
jgi:hypothetical protein